MSLLDMEVWEEVCVSCIADILYNCLCLMAQQLSQVRAQDSSRPAVHAGTPRSCRELEYADRSTKDQVRGKWVEQNRNPV